MRTTFPFSDFFRMRGVAASRHPGVRRFGGVWEEKGTSPRMLCRRRDGWPCSGQRSGAPGLPASRGTAPCRGTADKPRAGDAATSAAAELRPGAGGGSPAVRSAERFSGRAEERWSRASREAGENRPPIAMATAASGWRAAGARAGGGSPPANRHTHTHTPHGGRRGGLHPLGSRGHTPPHQPETPSSGPVRAPGAAAAGWDAESQSSSRRQRGSPLPSTAGSTRERLRLCQEHSGRLNLHPYPTHPEPPGMDPPAPARCRRRSREAASSRPQSISSACRGARPAARQRQARFSRREAEDLWFSPCFMALESGRCRQAAAPSPAQPRRASPSPRSKAARDRDTLCPEPWSPATLGLTLCWPQGQQHLSAQAEGSWTGSPVPGWAKDPEDLPHNIPAPHHPFLSSIPAPLCPGPTPSPPLPHPIPAHSRPTLSLPSTNPSPHHPSCIAALLPTEDPPEWAGGADGHSN